MIVDHHECRQTLVFRAQPVRHPRPDTRQPHLNLAGIQFIRGLHVVVRFSVDRAQERHLIHMLRQQREDLRNIHPALAVFAELKRAGHQRARIPLAHHNVALAGQRLSGILGQRGLGVERIQMADAAAHEQRNHAGGARSEMRFAGRVRVVAPGFGVAGAAGLRRAQQSLLVQQIGQRQTADTAAGLKQEIASGPETLHVSPHV